MGDRAVKCPICATAAPHDRHLLGEPQSPLAMRVRRDGATLFLPDGTLLWRRQPDAVRKLRADVRHWAARV